MRKWISLIAIAGMIMSSSLAFASSNDLAYKGVTELETATTVAAGDYTVVYDASTDTVKKVDANSPAAITGDLTFQSSLIAAGRVNAAATLASSSTAISPTSLPYVVVLKAIGGSGYDDTDGGTRLQDGTPGQILVLAVVSVGHSGTWVVTPDTATGFTAITFDTAGENAMLLYVDDTIGWIVVSNEGATVTLPSLLSLGLWQTS
jgi:hypothetical protein